MKERSAAVGLKLIVGYKLAKAVAEVLLGLLLLFYGSAGRVGELRAVALTIRHHAAAAWSVALAEQLVRGATERNMLVVSTAAILDGVFSAVEGWALHRRYGWSRWLIVGATSCLLPFEFVALVRHPSAGRIALLAVNALIVLYLAPRSVAVARD